MKYEGFSLIELLIGTTVVGILSVVIMQVLFTTIRSNSKIEVVKNIKQNGDYAATTMTRLIQNAGSVDVASCGEAGGEMETSDQLTLNQTDGTILTFKCFDGRIVYMVGETLSYITGDGVQLTIDGVSSSCGDAFNPSPLVFSCTLVGGKPRSIKITFGLKQKGTPGVQYEKNYQTFQTTVNVRN